MSYIVRIFSTGLVSTWCGNWHDLLNALMWMLWPGLKAAATVPRATAGDR